MKNNILYFGNPKDKRTGYLCPDSYYSFEFEGKQWSTVMHYVLAKSNPYMEDKIRNASTVYGAKRVVNSGIVLKKNTPLLKEKLKTYIIDSNKAKFSQNASLKKLLLSTGECRLKHTNTHGLNKYVGRILCDIRESMKPQSTNKSREIYKDFLVPHLTKSSTFIIDGLSLI